MIMAVQRRQPSKQQKCKYGRKCFKRDIQHLKQFCHPKVSYYEASLPDEGKNTHEDDSKECADHSTIAINSDSRANKSAEPTEDKSENEANRKQDQYDKRVCRYRKHVSIGMPSI
ncbi:hypothetical protein MTO96_016929 [Rhipicephalus appendiculatus]